MEYIEGKCPKCGGELKVPETLNNIICMYCGKSILKADLVLPIEEKESQYNELEKEIWYLWENKDSSAVEKARELLELERQNYIANYVFAIGQMHKIVIDNMRLMFCFKESMYAKEMKEYKESTRDIFVALETIYLLRENEKENIIHEATLRFMSGIQEHLDTDPKLKSKFAKKAELDSLKTILALFTVPMIQLQALSVSMPFVESINKKWNETYSDFHFKVGGFEELNTGFRKKGFCYITTSVCETLDKSDDCYELTMFRQFRDQFLRKEKDGETLVQQYYLMAPKIVDKINQSEVKNTIYTGIWDKYLSSCLSRIELGDNAGCKELYVEMMYELNSKWGQ